MCVRAFADQGRVLAFHAASIDSDCVVVGLIKIGEEGGKTLSTHSEFL